MPDETTQTEPVIEQTPAEETRPAPIPNSEPVAEAPIPTVDSAPVEATSEATGALEGSEGVVVVKDQNQGNASSIPIPDSSIPSPDSPIIPTLQSLFQKLKEKLSFRTEKRLAKILELAKQKKTITNDEVEKLLHVSDASASNYLNKLVKRGQLQASGSKSHSRYIISN